MESAFVKKVLDGQMPGVVIDTRPVRKKYDRGHLPGALSMPTSQFDKKTDLLPRDKAALIVFYCQGPT